LGREGPSVGARAHVGILLIEVAATSAGGALLCDLAGRRWLDEPDLRSCRLPLFASNRTGQSEPEEGFGKALQGRVGRAAPSVSRFQAFPMLDEEIGQRLFRTDWHGLKRDHTIGQHYLAGREQHDLVAARSPNARNQDYRAADRSMRKGGTPIGGKGAIAFHVVMTIKRHRALKRAAFEPLSEDDIIDF
jgi:hypothetical protein